MAQAYSQSVAEVGPTRTQPPVGLDVGPNLTRLLVELGATSLRHAPGFILLPVRCAVTRSVRAAQVGLSL